MEALFRKHKAACTHLGGGTRAASRRSRETNAGLSYLEVLIAFSILTVLVAIGLPRLDAYRSLLNLRQAGRRVAGDLRLAQQMAISQETNYRWVYSAGSPPKYTIVKASDSTVVRDVEFPEDITLTTGPTGYTPEYTPTGAPLAPGGLCLTEPRGNGLTLSIKAGTGRVHLQDGLVDECAP
jgi:type II secretory pathway pseudopilin PulG